MKKTVLTACLAGAMLLGGTAAQAAESAAITYPEGNVTDRFGYVCHNFEIDGAKAFIMEPKQPAPGNPWIWCLAWPDAFWTQLPGKALLDMGWHYVYIDCHDLRMNPEGVKRAEKFYARLQEMHFAPKAALMGMSVGGFYSLRWAAEHPETVSCIYLDAPVCSFNYQKPMSEKILVKYETCFGTRDEEVLANHPLAPVNNVTPIANAKIPIYLIRHGQDQTVNPVTNSDLFAERFRAAGGEITVKDFSFYGHHPHGLFDPKPLVDFMLQHQNRK